MSSLEHIETLSKLDTTPMRHEVHLQPERNPLSDRHSKLAKASVYLAAANVSFVLILLLLVVGGGMLHDKFRNGGFWDRLFFKTSDGCFIILVFHLLSTGPLGFLAGLCLGLVGSVRLGLRKSVGMLGVFCNAVLLALNIVFDLLIGLIFLGMHGPR